MSPQSETQAWLEAATGARYGVPEGASSPINVGRVGAPGAVQDGIGIPQSEQTRFISRKHANLWRLDDGTWQVSDAGSASGLWVNGVKASGDTRFPLIDGTKLKLGNFEVTFHVAAGAPATAAAGEGGEDGGTMVLRDFRPSASAASAAPAGVAAEEKRFLDTRGGDQAIEIEIPQKPGVTQWTIGRALKAEGNDPAVDHVSVPNLPEFNSVSRRQVILSHTLDDRWTIKNLSSQGSKLNNEPLSGDSPTPIRAGDRLMMGNRTFFFREGVIRPHYRDEDFGAAPAFADSDSGADNPDLIDTRELPLGSRHGMKEETDELTPWGELVENKLMGARAFPLRKRKTKIGSHPITSDIKLDDPGIDDLHATIEWGSKDCKIYSRSHDSPIRVNHASYRVSPPLTTGAVITIGNQEYHIEITGLPPEATSTLVIQRVRRLVVFGIISVVLICAGTLFLAKTLTPSARAAVATAPPETADVIKDVLSTRGLAGLSLLVALGDQGKMTPELETILKQIHVINQIDYLVDKSPEREFRQSVTTIDKQLQEARAVFTMAGLPATMADSGWFKQLQDSFHERQGKAYTGEWNVLLTALHDNNLANAQRMLSSMANTQKEKLDEAVIAIDRWSKISEAMRTRSQNEILDGYMDGVRNQRTAPFIGQQRTQLSALVEMLTQIEKDPSETSDALMGSSQWKDYKDKLGMLDNTLKAVEAYLKGSTGDFATAYQALPDDKKTNLLKTMASNLTMWDEWQDSFKKAGAGANANTKLIDNLIMVKGQFSQSQDINAPVYSEISSRLNSLTSTRGTEASRLRQQAAQLPDGFDKLDKLLDAYQYDATSAAESEIDGLAAKLCGQILKDNQVAQNADKLSALKGRLNGYLQGGSMHNDNVGASSLKQIDSLLKQAGR